MKLLGRFLLVAVSALALVSCSSPSPSPTPTFSVTPTPTPTSSDSSLPQGVIATGALVGVGFETTGTVSLSHTDDVVVFELVNFATAAEGSVNLMFSRATEPTSRTCFDTGYRFDAGPSEALPVEIPASLFVSDKMTDFRSAVITLAPTDASAECLGEVVAIAELEWDIP